MSTYVINNRIPRFPIKGQYADIASLQRRLEEIFQVWLKEVLISNLVRRKACSQLYDYSVWLTDQKKCVEDLRAVDFLNWCAQLHTRPQADWGHFLAYARKRLPELAWESPAADGVKLGSP